MTLELSGHIVPHFKALRYGKDEKGRLSSRGISSIYQDVLKNGNLLHKTGLVDSQMVGTVYAPIFGPVFSYNLQFFRYFIENKAVQAFYFP